jgi:hypothetical protein
MKNCRNRYERIMFTRNNENRIYEGPPPQGLSEARWAGSFLNF